jgi:hypothetical protein
MLFLSPEERQMESTSSDDSPSSNMSPAARQFAQPWWLHPRRIAAAPPPPSRDARREFTAMATQIGLAAWMLGTALMSSCGPADRFSIPAAHFEWLLLPPGVAERQAAPAARIPTASITATHVVAASASAPH